MKFNTIFNDRIFQLIQVTNEEFELLQSEFTLEGWSYKGRKKYKWTREFMKMSTYLSSGFWHKLMKFSQEKNIRIEIDGIQKFVNPDITLDGITEWVGNLSFRASWLDPRWYQIKALYFSQRYPISRGDFATGSGKTFICYLVSRYILEKKLQQSGKKVLMVVPSVQLVTQTMNDWKDDYMDDDFIQLDIRSAEFPEYQNENGNVILGNIDTLKNYPKEFFKDVGAIIYDEAHKLTTNTYKKIFDHVQHNELSMIYSVSGSWWDKGTPEDMECEELSGPILLEVPAWLLMQEGSLTPVRVNEIPIIWSRDVSEGYYNAPDCQVTEFKNMRNHFELSYIRSLRQRVDFISGIIKKIEYNQLLLFKSVSYLEEFERVLKELCPDKEVLKIIGDISGKRREEIKKITESQTNVIIVATYGTMSTGVSINNLTTLHFIEPPKSFVWVRQSIGRTLRLHMEKSEALIISYVDIFKKYDKAWKGPHRNIAAGHLKHRVDIYEKQRFPYKILKQTNL